MWQSKYKQKMFAVLFNDVVIGFANSDGESILEGALSVYARYVSLQNPVFVHIDALPNSCAQWEIGNILVVKTQDYHTLHKVVEKDVTNWAFVTKKKHRSEELGSIKIYSVGGIAFSQVSGDSPKSEVSSELANVESKLAIAEATINALKHSITEQIEINDEIARDRDEALAEVKELNGHLAAMVQKNNKYKATLTDLILLFNQATGKNTFNVEDSGCYWK